ncbi:uncharacterized protein [Choristoneura fumiferana]|uniref:uncharacterized protein n=1 Tax=Choristoneura fumiferana TaxID=7141 RepID=UPI003D156533
MSADVLTKCLGVLHGALLAVLHRGVHRRAPDASAPHAPPDHVLALAVYLLDVGAELAAERAARHNVSHCCGTTQRYGRGRPRVRRRAPDASAPHAPPDHVLALAVYLLDVGAELAAERAARHNVSHCCGTTQRYGRGRPRVRRRAPDASAPHAPPDHVLALAVYLLDVGAELAAERAARHNRDVCVASGEGGSRARWCRGGRCWARSPAACATRRARWWRACRRRARARRSPAPSTRTTRPSTTTALF